jgi:hypothetical protein
MGVDRIGHGMNLVLGAVMAAAISDWSGCVGALAAVVGLIFVGIQLRRAAAASRAEATIQFQRAFLSSAPARGRIQRSFPVHVDTLERVAPGRSEEFDTWSGLGDLTEEQRNDAVVVMNAMNDVAQYVADGLSLRSALQQYHAIFVRLGFLVLPYIDARNEPIAGRPQVRLGRRLVDLYNGALSYHRLHYKHQGHQLVLERPAPDGSGKVRLVLIDADGRGVAEHPPFPDETAETLRKRIKLRRSVRAAERRLRR